MQFRIIFDLKYIVIYIYILFILILYYFLNKEEKGKSKFFLSIKKKINCTFVYNRMKNRKASTKWPPPRLPPSHLYRKFTQNGEMPIKSRYYFAQKYSGSSAMCSEWNAALINRLINLHRENKKIGIYSLSEEKRIDQAITKYNITKKKVVIIGSEMPWIEAIVASKYPESITTIEYGKINSTIPYLRTYTPNKFAEIAIDKKIEFDFAISYSSLEHSGLGRYGDELNPNGDIEASEEVWCMLKKKGLFLIGLPYTNRSFIRWNADRNYGPERMKYMAANYEQLEFFGKPFSGQIPLILRKL